MELADLREYVADQTEFGVSHVEVLDWDGTDLRLRRQPIEAERRLGGAIAGPSLVGMADHASFLVVVGRLGLGAQHATTVNLSADFLRRAEFAPLVVECRLLKLGRRLVVTDTLIRNETDPRPVAHISMTYTNPLESEDWMAAPAP